nr:gliding motility-associated C-terminal domain-containing protein [uncultured Dyadobacter sp.]
MLKDLRLQLLILSLIAWFTPLTYANHIVGGELQMKATGSPGSFEITLIQFWDQNNITIPTATKPGNRDPDVDLHIYQKSDKSFKTTFKLSYINTETIIYQNKACAVSRSLNTSIGYYRGTIQLDPDKYNDPEGYYIAWERCCRNDDINNIEDPGDNGMVFYLEFPPLSARNSSPEFVAPNGQYICANRLFSMNMSATDADGDELRYSLVTPMRGHTDPRNPNGDKYPGTTFPLVSWSRGIGLSNIIPGSSPLKISSTGQLTVNAGTLGLYVFTVQCEEFRNGRRIGLVRRDFQLLVIDCTDDQPEPPVIMQNEQPVTELVFCKEAPVELKTQSSPDWAYQWQLNGLNIPGATTASIMVKDSGSYSVVKSYINKCSRDTNSLVVKASFAPPIPAEISALKQVLCKTDSIVLLANGGTVAASEQAVWRKGAVPLEEKTPQLVVREPGVYELEISNAIAGCSGRDTIEITREELSVTLPEKKGVVEGGRATIIPVVTPDGPGKTFAWTPAASLISAADEQNASVAPVQQEQLFTLVVTSEQGCSDTDSVLVYLIKKMYIPTTFSPNNDGHNDTFQIFNADNQILQMRIYNRWGTMVFYSDGYAQPWNGTYKNSPVPAGDYPYVIKTESREIMGTILLLK